MTDTEFEARIRAHLMAYRAAHPMRFFYWSCGADCTDKFDIVSFLGRPRLICHRPSLRESGCPTSVGTSTPLTNDDPPTVGGTDG